MKLGTKVLEGAASGVGSALGVAVVVGVFSARAAYVRAREQQGAAVLTQSTQPRLSALTYGIDHGLAAGADKLGVKRPGGCGCSTH